MSTDLAGELYEGIADMVARSWRALGVPLAARPVESTIIDPEALIMLTAWLTGPSDARVHSGALAWSIRNHSLINAVRLDNMAAALPPEMASRFESFAATVNNEVSGSKWTRGVGDDIVPYGVVESKPLVPMDAEVPALLRIRLRSLAGANARSEALAVLLTAPAGQFTTAAVARDAYVAQPHARRALDALAVGGWVERWQVGRDNRYRISEQSRGAFGSVPTWVSWGDRIRILYSLLESARALDDMKPLAATVAVSELVEAQFDALHHSAISVPNWRNADSPEGIERITGWMRATASQLVEVS